MSLLKPHLKLRLRSGSAMVEFAPALFILFLFVFFPAVNLVGLATGTASIAILTNRTAAQVASQSKYDDSLQAMVRQANSGLATGFAHFANLKPIAGYQGCGCNLYVLETNYRTGGTSSFGPNIPMSPPVDTTSNIYEFRVHAVYDVGPVVNLHAVPLIGNVPGLGGPARISYDSDRAVELPAGLDNGAGSYNAQGGTVNKFDRTIVNTNPQPGALESGWNYPNVYQAIAEAGQTVVTEKTIIVPSNTNNEWTNSGVTVTPSEKVWIDTNAVGKWESSLAAGYTDANGTNQYGDSVPNAAAAAGNPSIYPSEFIDGNAPFNSLIGSMGTNPPIVKYQTGPANDPNLFFVGNTLTNYPITKPGPINFIVNNNGPSGTQGYQLVRLIVTQ